MFIKLITQGKKVLINVNNITMIEEETNNSCTIYTTVGQVYYFENNIDKFEKLIKQISK